ncbi:MAG: crossover junction endodeoxyribonuclease RuvC [Candidatus Blackburnbacteria bacterium]|nr:crossover junction endodeoxyribonuclease RuvC [Candidatus Blackburnbacteria bacterium]
MRSQVEYAFTDGIISLMLIIGIDPGTATTGYGLVKVQKSGQPTLVKFGWIKTESNGQAGKRLDQIFREMSILLKEHTPDVLAIERLFFYSNAKTAMAVGQACGVIMLAAARRKIPIYEYPPGQVKLVVGGNGRADKSIMKQSVRKMFGVRAPNKKKTYFDDAADAIAVAVCHARMANKS